MEAFFQSSLFAYTILSIIVLELILLCSYFLLTNKGVAPWDAFTNLVAGGALILAMGLMLDGVAWQWVALLFFISMIAHLCDIANRWKSESSNRQN